MDYWVFWVGLFVPAVVWSIFAIGSVFHFSFDWLLLILTALALRWWRRPRPATRALCAKATAR